jgi:DnaJ-domain-containing protein 1
MADRSERRRKARKIAPRGGEAHWVTLSNVPGSDGEVAAKIIDLTDIGLAVETQLPLTQHSVVLVNRRLGADGSSTKARARVVHCDAIPGGYQSGLSFENGPEPNIKPGQALPDYYEILQISPNADPDMIHRVYRLLAQRYHPDNTVTGDEQTFRAITEAYRILSEPEKRAAFDVNLHSYRQVRWRLFDQRQAAKGKSAEKSKRRGIIELLYTQRSNQPEKPTLDLRELEDLLGCPREHLEFSLWYLKENGLVTKGDNGRFAVTAKGVDWAETEEAAQHSAENRLLTASHS